jgi:hypothetical protein
MRFEVDGYIGNIDQATAQFTLQLRGQLVRLRDR